ncbi:hypothetical protein ANN_21180 [Periplaneta americana]|uniref:Uncharacterized protein n=1 Tax=Periplaneta americana TaxID=6978 RepID=A0ABQ8SFT3_PERAM|nr:hypothetical protein ANN_21180 [Periplaneta americana]
MSAFDCTRITCCYDTSSIRVIVRANCVRLYSYRVNAALTRNQHSSYKRKVAFRSLIFTMADMGLEHIKTLKKIQKQALKCYRKNSPLKWDTLTDRRTRIRLCALFKTYGEYDCQNSRKRERSENIWVSVDQSTDVSGRYLANVVVGILSENCVGKKFVLTSEKLEKAEVKIEFTVRKYRRTPVLEGGSKRCFRFSTVNPKLLAYADDVNLFGENPQTIRENTKIPLEAKSGLNPIEHYWGELDRRLRSREMRRTFIVQLRGMLQEEWRRIPVDILQKVVESMPDKMAAVTATRATKRKAIDVLINVYFNPHYPFLTYTTSALNGSYPGYEYLRRKLFLYLASLMLAGNEFQSLGRAIVKEDEYEEVRWDGIVSIVSWRERVFRLWWEERLSRVRTSGYVFQSSSKGLGLSDHVPWKLRSVFFQCNIIYSFDIPLSFHREYDTSSEKNVRNNFVMMRLRRNIYQNDIFTNLARITMRLFTKEL